MSYDTTQSILSLWKKIFRNGTSCGLFVFMQKSFSNQLP